MLLKIARTVTLLNAENVQRLRILTYYNTSTSTAKCYKTNTAKCYSTNTTTTTNTTIPVEKSIKMPDTSFEGHADRFNGVLVVSDKETCSVEDLPNKLKVSLENWIQTNKRGIWFKVYLNQSAWIPVLAKHEFIFHHARTEFVMMVRWLPRGEYYNIPPFAHTMLGVGAIVINDETDEILVVKERYTLSKESEGNWKLPGGYVDPGENLVDAAIREVHEETAVHTEFLSLVCSRHAHHTATYDCSDIYTVFSLRPTSTGLVADERELLACKWMPVGEYLASERVHDMNKFVVERWLQYRRDGVRVECRHAASATASGGKPYTLYYVESDKVTNKN